MSKAKEKFESELWERVLQRFAAGVPADEVDTKHLERIFTFALEETTKSYRFGKARSARTVPKQSVPRIPRPHVAGEESVGNEDDLGSR